MRRRAGGSSGHARLGLPDVPHSVRPIYGISFAALKISAASLAVGPKLAIMLMRASIARVSDVGIEAAFWLTVAVAISFGVGWVMAGCSIAGAGVESPP